MKRERKKNKNSNIHIPPSLKSRYIPFTHLKRYLFVGDHHIPDHNTNHIRLINLFISDFKPDVICIMGDFVNFTKMSKFDQDPYYHVDIVDEVQLARSLLDELIETAKKANRKVQIIWFEGNHEQRLIRYLGRNALQLAELKVLDENVVSIPHLFELKRRGIEWVPAYHHKVVGGYIVRHGMLARKKAGYTAQASLEQYGTNGSNGHTHRLGMVGKTQMGITKYWFETGCLCNLQPTPPYTVNPDWQSGFFSGILDTKRDILYPTMHPIVDGSVSLGDRVISL